MVLEEEKGKLKMPRLQRASVVEKVTAAASKCSWKGHSCRSVRATMAYVSDSGACPEIYNVICACICLLVVSSDILLRSAMNCHVVIVLFASPLMAVTSAL